MFALHHEESDDSQHKLSIPRFVIELRRLAKDAKLNYHNQLGLSSISWIEDPKISF